MKDLSDVGIVEATSDNFSNFPKLTLRQTQGHRFNIIHGCWWSVIKHNTDHLPVDQREPYADNLPLVLSCMLSQGGRGSGSKLTKPSGCCRATSLSTRSTYAGSPVTPPAVPCVARPTATPRAPKWRTTTHLTMLFAPRRAQIYTDRTVTSSKQSFSENIRMGTLFEKDFCIDCITNAAS